MLSKQNFANRQRQTGIIMFFTQYLYLANKEIGLLLLGVASSQRKLKDNLYRSIFHQLELLEMCPKEMDFPGLQ